MLCLLLMILTSSWSLAENSRYSFQIGWDEEPQASGYQVELQAEEGGEKQTFTVKETRFQQDLNPGFYFVRIRSLDKEGRPSPWSEPIRAHVQGLPLLNLSPKDQSLIGASQEREHEMVFRWKPYSTARSYRLKVFAPGFEKFVVTEKTQAQLTLAAGKTYEWTVSVTDDKGNRYRPRGRAFQFQLLYGQLQAPQLQQPESTNTTSLSWNGKYENYKVRLFEQFLLAEDWQERKDFELLENKIQFPEPLRPRRYRIEVQAVSTDGQLKSAVAKKVFLVKPQ